MQGFLIPYEIAEKEQYIIYSLELWNYINDGIIVVYDKKSKVYTDDGQTQFELACLGYEIDDEPKYLEQVKKLVKLKYQQLSECKNFFEIVSKKGVKANDREQIYLNAMAQYTILEIFRTKNLLEEK